MSPLENLPVEIFGHIMGLRGYQNQDSVPCCSTRCKEMWLEFAERKTTEVAAEFVRPFEFAEGSSLTQRYYQVNVSHESFMREGEEVKSIEKIKVEEIIERVRSLLERNPVRQWESLMLKICGKAVDAAARELKLVQHTLRDNLMLKRLSDTANSIANRWKALLDRGGGDEERNYCLWAYVCAANLCFMKRPRDEENTLDLVNRALALNPLHVQALWIKSLARLHRGNIDPAFAAIQKAMRSACSDPRRAKYVGRIGREVMKRRRYYGAIRSIGLFREAASSLTDLLAGNESISEEIRSKIVTGKAEIEELLGRLTGRQG